MTSDRAASLLGVVAGSGIVAGALALGVGRLTDPSPGSFPLVAGLVLVASSSMLLVQSRFASGSAPARTAAPHRRWLVIVAMVLYAALLESTGYLLATTTIGVVLLRILGLPWRRAAGLTVPLAVCSYLLFARLLGVELPSGPLDRIF